MRGFSADEIRSAAIVIGGRLRRRAAVLGQPVQEPPTDDDHRLRDRRRRRSSSPAGWSSTTRRGLPLARPRGGIVARRSSACSSWPGRRRPRSACSPTSPSASRPIAARSWACTRCSSPSARSPGPDRRRGGRLARHRRHADRDVALLLVALVPLARLRGRSTSIGVGGHVGGRGRRATGVTDGRPWAPVPLARGSARRGRGAAPPRDARPGSRSCARAAPRWTRRSRRTPSSAWSCPAAAASVATRSG